MELQPIARFELNGLSTGVYLTIEGGEKHWFVVSTSSMKTIEAFSLELAFDIFRGCINEIWSQIGFRV